MSKEDKKWLYLMVISIGALVFFMILIVTGNNALYADGSHHLISMMLDENWNDFYTHRGGAMFLHYGFAYLAMKFGVTSVKNIVDLYSFGYALWIVLFYGFTVIKCYRKKNFKIMSLTILYFCFVLTNSGFMTVIQSNITAAWFWCTFVYLYLGDMENVKQEIILLFLACMGININEYTVFLNFFLIVFLILKLKNEKIKVSKWAYLIASAFIAGFLRGFDGTFIHQDINPTGDLLNCIKIPVPLLWGQLITLGILLILLLLDKKKPCVILDSLIILSVFSVCIVCVWRIVNGTNLISYMSNIVRIYNLVIPIMLVCYVMLENQMKIHIDEKYLHIPAYVFLICFLIYFMSVTNDYQIYGSNIAQYCKDHDGMIPRSEVNYESSYNWGWTSVQESILIQMYYGNNNIHCLIVNDGQDDEISNMEEFYNKYSVLKKYNTYFDAEKLQ